MSPDDPPFRRARSRRRGGAWAGTLLAVAFSAHASADAATRYVAPSGSDRNPGTAGRPFKTVGRGIAGLRPGDTTLVRGGVYPERVERSMPGCSASAPCALRNYPGEHPVVQGLVSLRGGSHWRIRGINVTWGGGSSEDHMVKITGGASWMLRDSELWGARSFADLLIVGAPRDWRVSGNCIHDTVPSNGTNQDHNVYANTGLTAGRGEIDHNIIYNATNGSNLKIAGATSSQGSTGLHVHNNTMYNASQNVLIGGASHDNLLDRNILAGAHTRNVRAYQLSGAGNVVGRTIGTGAAEFFTGDAGYPGRIALVANRTGINPRFDATTCRGFHPRKRVARSYGRYAR